MSDRIFRHREEEIAVEISRDGSSLRLRRSEPEVVAQYEARRVGSAEYALCSPTDPTATHTAFAIRDGDQVWIHLDGRTYLLERVRQRASGRAHPGGLVAPTPATVQEVLVADGEAIESGQVLLVLTAMKMQIEIKAPHDGVVRGLKLSAGDQVDGGVALLQVVAAEN